MKNKIIVRSFCLCATLLGSCLSPAWAANVIKLDTATMNGATDWSVAPGATDVGEFDSTVSVANLAAMTLGGAVTLGGLQFDGTMQGPLAVSAANTLTLGANGINMSAANQSVTFNNLLALGAAQTWLVDNSQTLAISNVVSGAGFPLTINDGSTANSGRVLFGAQANTYTGGTLINGGVVQVGVASSLGTGAITNNGGILRLPSATALTISVPLYFTGTSMLDLNNITGSPSLNGPWSGSGTVIITNLDVPTSTLTIGGSAAASTMNNFTGKIIIAQNNSGGLISQGSLRFNSGSTAYNFGNASASFNLGTNGNVITLTSRDGGTINIGELIGGPQTVLLGSRSVAGTTTWSVGGLNTSTTFAGSISNFGGTAISALAKVGTGTLILTGTNTDFGTITNGPTGPTTVSAGTLQIGDGNADGTLTSGNVTIAAAGTLSFDRSDNYTVINSIANSGALTVFGGGTNMYNTGTYTGTGAINVNSGGFVLASPVAALGPIYVGPGATFDVSQDSSLTSVQSLSGSGTVNIVGGSLTTVTVTGGVSPGGTGTAGTLTVNGGLIENGNVNNQFVLSQVGGTNDLLAVNGSLNVSTGTQSITLSEFGGGLVPPGIYPLITYTGTLTGGAGNFSVAAIGFNATVTNITTTSPPEIAVIVTAAARSPLNLTWAGDSTTNVWDLTSTNWLYSGTKYVFLAGDSALFNDSGSTNPPVSLKGNVFPTSLVVSNTTAKHYTFTGSGSIAGTTGLTKTNSGILTILNTNSYTGPTIVGGGVLEVESGATSGSPSPIGAASSNPTNLVFYGSTFRYSGIDASNYMDHSMTIVTGATVDITNAGTTFVEGGLVTGPGGLTKVGQGTLALQIVNTYTGGTVISNGVLAMGSQNANWDGATGSGVGPINAPVTFMGTNNATLQLFGVSSNALIALNNFYNPLVIPAGQMGTLELPGRGNPATGVVAGLNSSLTGGGTMNLVANYVRYPLSGNWSGFTGQINVTGAGFANANANTVGAVTANVDELRINNTNGYANAAIYLDGQASANLGNSPPSKLVMCQTVASGATINIGELGGDYDATIGTGTGSSGNTTWSVGWKNTTNTFAGTIANDAQTGVGVTSITKVGTGEWILAGVNTYSGSTTVSNGVLALIANPDTANDASISNSANIFINTGAVLDLSGLGDKTLYISINNLGGGGTLIGSVSAGLDNQGNIIPVGGNITPAGALTINGNLTEGVGFNNNFTLSTTANTNAIRVLGTLDVSRGIQNINLSGVGTNTIAAGTYPLFTYTGSLIGGTNNFVVNVGAFAYTTKLAIIATTPPEIAVIVGAPVRQPANLVWSGDGVANNWDTTGMDWLVGAAHFSFLSGDSVFFTDAGAANTNVTLQNALYPISVVVSNSTLASYTFTGSGSIAGSIGLTKTNSGTLTILAANTYTGPTVIGGGTISISSLPKGGLAGPIGASSNNSTNLLFAGGTLAYTGPGTSTDRGATLIGSGGTYDVIAGASLTNFGVIAGSGALNVVDTGNLILAVANTYTGGTTVSNSTLTLSNILAAGTGTITLVSNATLVLKTAGTVQYNNPINVIGNDTISVPNTGAALLPEMNGPFIGNGTVVLNMDTANGTIAQTFGFGTNGMANFNGTFKIADNTTNGYVRFYPNIGVNAGINGSSGCLFDLGTNSTATGAAATGVRFFDRTGNPIDLLGALAGGPNTLVQGAGSATTIATTFVIGGKNINATYYGSIQDGAYASNTNGGDMVSVTKVGTGTQTLAGTNTYSGPTIVSNGMLQINGSISNGPVTVSGGTLSGFGTIAGAVSVQAGGTLAPGAGTNVAGTVLTLNSNLTLQAGGTVLMQVSHSANDQITSAGTITYGGILMVATNAGDATYAVSQTFTLFNLNGGTYSAGSGFATIQPPPGPGLGWSGTNLTVNGSIQVVAALPVVAGFTAGPTTGVAPLGVTFTNLSSGATYWVWNFGDGSTFSTGGNTNVSYTYANVGSYTVSLTAYGPGGMSALTNTAYIVVGNATPPAPVAGFSGTPTTLFVTQAVAFTDASTGSITNRVWSYGDGHSVTNTTSVNVTNIYALAGSYTVSLIVNGPGGSSTNTKANYVVVKPKTAIVGVTLAGGKLVFSGANGPAGQQYRILTAANVALPLAGWTPVWTNVFAADGSYSYTNTPGVNAAGFFLLVSP